MDSATLTAVISAAVSVVSVAANVYIARRSRQSEVESLKLKARLEHDELADKIIKEIEIEGERLRIRAWELIAACQSADPAHQKARTLSSLIDAFAAAAGEFVEKWAPVKSELACG